VAPRARRVIVHRVFHHEAAAFVVACLSLIPLARSMGDATRSWPNARPRGRRRAQRHLRNAAELIVGIFAVAHGTWIW